MGKRKQKHHGGKKQYQSKKRQKQQRYWIEDCPDLLDDDVVLDERNLDTLLMAITAAYLTDGHQQIASAIVSTGQAIDPQSTFVCQGATVRSIPPATSSPLDGTDTGRTSEASMNAGNTSEQTSSPPVIYIQRVVEPNVKLVRTDQYREHFRNLPNGNNGDGIVNPHKDVSDKYWSQRKRLFTKFDDGVKLDAEGWFSVTPEAVATHIARRMTCRRHNATQTSPKEQEENEGYIVLDAFVGVGGNAIAFAQCPNVELVVCVDTSLERLCLAAHNCHVYNVPVDKVLFVHGDACHVLRQYQLGVLVPTRGDTVNLTSDSSSPKTTNDANGYMFGEYDSLPRRLDVIFLSPPWSGPEYLTIGPRHFGLNHITLNETSDSCDGAGLLRMAVSALPVDRLCVGYYLPRNLNGLTLAQDCHTCGIRGRVELEQNLLNGKLKSITVYIDSGG